MTSPNDRAGRTSAPRTAALSGPFSAGTITSRMPAAVAALTRAIAPGTRRSEPSSASSPISAVRPSSSVSSWLLATRIAAAMARSCPVPSFGRSAGARLTVIRRAGTSKPELRSADLTRSRASSTALPGSPTIVSPGSPNETSTSTRTGMPSTPTIDALTAFASMGTPRREAMIGCGRCRPPACSPPYYQRRPAGRRLGMAAYWPISPGLSAVRLGREAPRRRRWRRSRARTCSRSARAGRPAATT